MKYSYDRRTAARVRWGPNMKSKAQAAWDAARQFRYALEMKAGEDLIVSDEEEAEVVEAEKRLNLLNGAINMMFKATRNML